MSPQAKRPAREYVPVRLSPDGLDEVRRLAEIETEGNVSQMIRKLLGVGSPGTELEFAL